MKENIRQAIIHKKQLRIYNRVSTPISMEKYISQSTEKYISQKNALPK
jgi:hypothetical protein